jgi:hypothetical protein
MGYIDDIKKISGSELVFSMLLLSGATCPGMLTIWHFDPAVIEKSGAVMFLLLSVAITLPGVTLNALIFLFVVENTSKVDAPAFAPFAIGASSCFAILIFGVPLLVAFMAGFSLKTFVWSVIGAEVLAIVACILVGRVASIGPASR